MESSSLEQRLNDFSRPTRDSSLKQLAKLKGSAVCPADGSHKAVNSHCHTFFSYNGYGMSPSAIAWWAAKESLFAAAIVDFDVLDGVEEFLAASELLGLRSGAGMETRVFIPELADQEINSPGEPGVAYHEGVGFVSASVPSTLKDFAARLRSGAAERTRAIVGRVNAYLAPVSVDFDKDVLPLTPGGNATERHVCAAYDNKARQVFADQAALEAFWAAKLAVPADKAAKLVADPVELRNTIRSKTMKSGGLGYVKPDPKSFPTLKEMNDFSLGCGAIPTLAWLNGESAGENAVDALFDLHASFGMAAVNIIPDRNHNFSDPKVREKKIAEMNRFIAAAHKRDLPILAGTEMNAPGQRLLDDFASAALKPHLAAFIDGAALQHAHTLLAPAGMGYVSDWAKAAFKTLKKRNQFFVAVGKKATWSLKAKLAGKQTPEAVLNLLG